VGYRFGRLFAILEKVQEEANPRINATIRDRFYGSASSVPVAAFPHLMKLKNHHLAKLENRGRAVNLEKLIGEIVGDIVDFPSHLSLQDQGRFAVGSYHQRQSLFETESQSFILRRIGHGQHRQEPVRLRTSSTSRTAIPTVILDAGNLPRLT
jgi:CRISPR-associated protein Csd1